MGYIDFTNLNQELQELIMKEGGGGTSPINAVMSVNRKLPDPTTGNVDTDWQMLESIPLNTPPSEYPHGHSEFILNPEDIEGEFVNNSMEMINPIVGNGQELTKVVVRTYVHQENGLYLQEFDDNINGIFDATYYRYSTDGITWSEIIPVSRVRTINGQSPDGTGNFNIPNATNDTLGLVRGDGTTIEIIDGVATVIGGGNEFVGEVPVRTDYSYRPTVEQGGVSSFSIDIPDYNPNTDVLVGIRSEQVIPNGVITYDYDEAFGVMNVALTNGWTVSSGYPFQLLRYKHSYTPRTDATVVDSLSSDSVTDALSANMGRILEERISGHIQDNNIHLTEADKVKLDSIQEGATKVVADGITIDIDEDGVISAIGGAVAWGNF